MSWFKRNIKGILTPTSKKKDTPAGIWYKTPNGKMITTKQLQENCYVSPEDGYHVRISPTEYFEILFDGKFDEFSSNIESKDPLDFEDIKKYRDRVSAAQKKTGHKDAVRIVRGKVNKVDLVVACMDFNFIGGSMGSVVGQKICDAVDESLKTNTPLLIICQSGGARLMESGYSLMQMAKTSAKLLLLSDKKIPYITLLTHPTTGGVTASYAMLGDITLAEPGALIGFAGPRVVKETIRKELPDDFQISESVLKHGFIDSIVDRRNLKKELTSLLNLLR